MKISLKKEHTNKIIVYICLLIILIAMNFVPSDVLHFFDTMIGTIISLCIIIYVGTIDLKIAILLSFIYLLMIVRSRKETDKESFEISKSSLSHSSDNKMPYGDDEDSPYANWQTTNYTDGDTPTSSNYCVPAGTDGCKDPYVASQNDPNWCAIPNEEGGNVRCIQKCPPRACTEKNSSSSGENITSECPSGQITSEDSPNFCCTPKKGESSCSCNPWKSHPGCPKYTTCGQISPPEEEEQKECPYVLVKQYQCSTSESEMETQTETENTAEGCPTVPSCSTSTRDTNGEKKNSNITPTQVPWLQKMGINTTDPYLKQANSTLYKRTHPLPYQSNYDGFNINQ